MTPSEMVSAVGRAARDGARGDIATGEFARGQLMSAYSACRHLAVELAEFPAELDRFSSEVVSILDRAGSGADAGVLTALPSQSGAMIGAQQLGDIVSEALDRLRRDGSPAAADARRQLHGAMRQVSEREVALLAAAIETADAR